MNTPLEQFIINPIIRINNNWVDITITNLTIYLIIAISIIFIIFNITIIKDNKLIKNRWGYLIERLYIEIENILKDMLPKDYIKYIPLTIIIFLFVLINNIIGLIPYSFTTTAHFIMTITMSLTIMIGVTLLGIFKHKHNFIFLFIPSGLNKGGIKFIIPLIFFIEILSYLIRVISLSVRLSANLISGHTLLKIVANFGLKYTISLPILLIFPIALLSAIYLLEIGVAIIQAYVFTLLTTTYIKDTELLH